MTMFTPDARIGRLALIAAAVAIALIAVAAPASMEAAGPAQTAAPASDSWLGVFGLFFQWIGSWFS